MTRISDVMTLDIILYMGRKMDIQDKYLAIQIWDSHLIYSAAISTDIYL